MTSSNNTIIDALAHAGYQPTATDFEPAGRVLRATVNYYAARGWDAVRLDADVLTFARWNDEGYRLLVTTHSGVIHAEATFTANTHGLRHFLAAATTDFNA